MGLPLIMRCSCKTNNNKEIGNGNHCFTICQKNLAEKKEVRNKLCVIYKRKMERNLEELFSVIRVLVMFHAVQSLEVKKSEKSNGILQNVHKNMLWSLKWKKLLSLPVW